MALDRLLAALARETSERAAGLVRAAEEQALALRTQEADACARREQQHREECAARLDAQTRRALAAARHAAVERVLLARAEVLERVMEAARARLAGLLEGDANRARVAAAVSDAIECAGDVEVVVHVSSPLLALLAPRFATRPAVRIDPDASVGTGGRVRAADGSFEIDATLESRLARSRAELLPEIARALAGEDAP